MERREALASGKDVVMRVDVQGAETVRKLAPNAILIFMTVDNEQELERRLRERKARIIGALVPEILIPFFAGIVTSIDEILQQAGYLLLLGNNPAGALGVKDFKPDPGLPERVAEMVKAMAENGFGNCTNHYECQAACPKGVNVKFIARMNREFLKALV